MSTDRLSASTGATVSQAAARQQLESHLSGPIAELTLLEKSLLFAELAMVAYMDHENARLATASLGFDEVTFFDNDGSQAFIFSNAMDTVLAFRGTEPNEWNDIKADANAVSVVAETIGRVHRGFKKEVDDLWPQLKEAIRENAKSIWFAGHSLGGAMATICAGRCKLADIAATPAGLFTYGSPRVGDRRYVTYCRLPHYRWVNNNDIVTRVPPRWIGYRHSGEELYFNTYGRQRKLTPWQRCKDRWRGIVAGLREGRIDPFSDHSILEYITRLRVAVSEERRS